MKKEEDQEKQKEEENHEGKFRKGMEEELEIDLRPATLLKKRLWQRYFPMNFAKFLRTPLLTEHLRWLLLAHIQCITSLLVITNCNPN